MPFLLFWIFAVFAVICGINLVLQTHPISSALSLIGVMGSLAVLYFLLGAEFIAAAQLVVYAGAIMVLFVFVIMLLNAGAERPSKRSWLATATGVPLIAIFIGLIAFIIQALLPKDKTVVFGGFTHGTAASVGQALFTDYLLPFEVTSVLILIALIGAIVLARKEID
ncbi:MAG: NADH-quinone oxidoreductase subunit J [Bryobacteraceae bacterium]